MRGISLVTKGYICQCDFCQKFIIPLNLNLNNDKFRLSNLQLRNIKVNIASIKNNVNMQFEEFKISISNPNNFQILSITC